MINEMKSDKINAMSYFSKANELDNDNLECIFKLGNYYFSEYNFHKARNFFKKYHTIINTSASASTLEGNAFDICDNLTLLGLCMLNTGDIENSIDIFNQCLELLPNMAK